MSCNRITRKSEKIRILKILRALNFFYSLRDLEEILNVPFQSLWKYVNFIGVPSDEVANEILEKLSRLKIIENTLNDVVKSNSNNYYNLVRNTGFIELFALVIEDKLRKLDLDIDFVFSLSEEGISIATSLAQELGTEMCFPLMNRNITEDIAKILWYYSYSEKRYKYMLIPRECIHRDKKLYMVDLFIDDVEKIKSIMSLMDANNVEIVGLSTVYICKECLNVLENINMAVLFYLYVV
jgi:adenine/guanine phosphoribosyltransferase-like PRPP-binding protein